MTTRKRPARPRATPARAAAPGSIAATWRAIEAALAAPRRLKPPATAPAMAALARALGRAVPRDLAASLAQHDGTRGDEPLWSNIRLLGAADIARQARMLRGLVARGDLETGQWSPAWIPLTDGDGDRFCLDGARVIHVSRTFARRAAGADYRTWLATVPARIRAEARAERRVAAKLADPAADALPARARQRLARIDGQLPFLIGFVDHLSRDGAVPGRARVLAFRGTGRLPGADVVARAFERGLLVEARGGVRVTPAGRALHGAAFR